MTESEVKLLRLIYELSALILVSDALPIAAEDDLRKFIRGIEKAYDPRVLEGAEADHAR